MILPQSTLLYPGSSLTLAMGAQDPYTQGHARRVAQYGEALARRLGLGAEETAIVRIGGLLHDIGKIAFSLQLRSNRNTKLTSAMRAEIRRHSEIGVNFLKAIHVAEPVIDCVRYHHERLDGSGYPYGLKADEIPLTAGIIGVADCFDALTTDRPYQKGRHPAQALSLMQQWAGRMFSPKLVRLLVEAVRAKGLAAN
jgi:putative nucleotidyltransferase with HDIG domain